jgi:high-affinity K+ transport system ATPase subunit B
MKRGGLLNRIDKQIWPDDIDTAVQKLEPNVTLGTVIIFFVILLAGVVLSILVLMVENCWYKLRHVKQEADVSPFNGRKY